MFDFSGKDVWPFHAFSVVTNGYDMLQMVRVKWLNYNNVLIMIMKQ